jgi:hypothetical protein
MSLGPLQKMAENRFWPLLDDAGPHGTWAEKSSQVDMVNS